MVLGKSRNYFKQMFKGEIPLSIVFWIWFIFLSFLIELLLQINLIVNIYLDGLLLIYSIFIFYIIFKSAKNYQGPKIWSFLAKSVITIYLFFSMSIFINIYKYYFLEDYYLNKDIEIFRKNLPIAVDLNSTLIDIYKNKKTIFYKYNLIGFDFSIEKNKNTLKKQVRKSICNDESTLELLKKDYLLNYTYINENEEEILKVETSKENCGKSIYDLEILSEILKKEEIF